MQNEKAVDKLAEAIFEDSPRIVFIIGAGTSISSGLRGGKEIKEQMQKDLENLSDTAHFRDTFGYNYYRVMDIIKKKKSSMEDLLEFYRKLYDYTGLCEWLRQFIPRDLGNQTPPILPSFAHEYCAHLVNMGILCTFISVNFDELLEAMLEEELGPGSFRVLASLSEFEPLRGKKFEDWDSECGLPKPKCYVLKPHGTISRSLSLRTEGSRVISFEKEKQAVLVEALRDALVVLIGFGLYNEDFRLLFGETFMRGITKDVIIVDKEPQNITKNFISSRPTRQVISYKGAADSFFQGVVQALYPQESDDKEKKKYKNFKRLHQKPTRHLIRSEFFKLFSPYVDVEDSEDEGREAERKRECSKSEMEARRLLLQGIEPKWIEQRIYELELLIYLMKSRGLFVQLASMDCKRIERAFNLCIKSLDIEEYPNGLDPYAILKAILNPEDGTDKLLGQTTIKDRQGISALNTYWCQLLIPKGFKFERESLEDLNETISRKVAERFVEHIKFSLRNEQLKSVIFPETLYNKNSVQSKLIDKLAGYFKDLSKDFDIDITNREYTTYMRFQNPEPLGTRKVIVNATEEIITKPDCVCLDLTTVTGEWLANQFVELKEKLKERGELTIRIISNLDAFETRETKEKELGQYLFHFIQMAASIGKLLYAIQEHTEKGATLEWYGLQNLEHHMFIASREGEDPENMKKPLLGAIYFLRPGKNTSITPVLLTDEPDIKEMWNYFDARIKDIQKINSKEYGKLRLFGIKIERDAHNSEWQRMNNWDPPNTDIKSNDDIKLLFKIAEELNPDLRINRNLLP